MSDNKENDKQQIVDNIQAIGSKYPKVGPMGEKILDDELDKLAKIVMEEENTKN